jgi:hypothetical protein
MELYLLVEQTEMKFVFFIITYYGFCEARGSVVG